MKVDFVIVGAQKCGTSSLAFQLGQHPQICFCSRKEPQYFSTTPDWSAHLAGYHRLFSPRPGQLCGEASTTYTCAPEYNDTHRRLFEYNPDLKLIYLMRHPVERMLSHYQHDLLAGRVSRDLVHELTSNPAYLNRSRYLQQLEPYLELFPRDRILLLIFEEYIHAPRQTLERIASFLDISRSGFAGVDVTAQNVSSIHGHFRKFPGWRAVRGIFYRTPEPFRRRVRSFLLGPGHSIFYRVEEYRVELPLHLRRELQNQLDSEIKGVEALVGRKLDVFRS